LEKLMSAQHDELGGYSSSASTFVETTVPPRPNTPGASDESPAERFIREHGLTLAVEETERLAREHFGHAFRRVECAVRVDGDFGTEYLHASALIASGVDALLDAEPVFFATLAACVPDADWSFILVSLTPCP
jgi:hypothetical protein